MTAEPLVPTAPQARAPAEASLSTFLFTDVEGSTRLWEEHPVAMRTSLATHDRILRDAVAAGRGRIVKTTGDGMLAVFDDPASAIAAGVEAQRNLAAASWGETGPLRVRMALHAGTAEARDGDYFGPALNRVARILAIGHGEQILASAAAAVLAREKLSSDVDLVDLGSHRLRDLDRPEEVFQVIAEGLRRSFPALRSLSTRRSNLPVQLTSFVGRDRELGDVSELVERHRLVTLIGTGGTGKTRLMVEVAARIGERFPDGAWLAELAPLSDAAQIPSEVARALGVPEEPGQPAIQTVTAYLGGKDVLLLVDNAEHLVDGVAAVAERLLGVAPGLRILATSREALAVPGEAVFQVQSLSCPVLTHHGVVTDDLAPPDLEAIAATEAVRLFVERAAAVAPEFTLTEGNATAVAEICRRLDGIPLAIELAAARVSAMSAVDIAKRLGDRFRLLAGGRRTAVPRQQTLHALIDWSWELLTEDDRRLLRRLSVFAGGWTTELAARVVDDATAASDPVELLDGLSRLVDRSLVIVDRGQTTRYRMLETIRQYAREQLAKSGEAPTIADRHFAAFKGLAEAAALELRGPAMGDWLDRLDAEADNLGAAMEWGLEASPWPAVEMASALMAYWSSRVASSDTEARLVTAIEIAKAQASAPEATREQQAVAARLLGEAARIWAMAGRPDLGLAWSEDAVALANASGDVTARIVATGGYAVSCAFSGRGRELKALFATVAELAETAGQWWFVAMSTAFAGASTYRQDPDEAEILVRRGEDAAVRSGNPYVLAATSIGRGRLLGLQHRPDEAAAAFKRAIDHFAEIGDVRFALAARSDMAHALRRGGRLDEAMAVYRETIGGWVHLGNRGAIANQLENMAYVAIDAGGPERAARLFGAAAAIRATAASEMAFDEIPEYESYVDRTRDALAVEAFDAAWTAGARLSLNQAVALALAD